MFRRTDVQDRMPRFIETIEAFDEARREGGFEGVSDAIVQYAGNMTPVGLDTHGSVVLPRNYNPTEGPAVLALHPHEQERTIRLKSNKAERRAASSILAQAGIISSIGADLLDHEAKFADFDAMVKHTDTTVTSPGDGGAEIQERFYIPRLLVIGKAAVEKPVDLGEVLAHELDHWDFFMNVAGTLPQHLRTDDFDQLTTIAEKRGYGVSFKIAQNLGHFAALGDIDTFLAPYATMTVDQAVDVRNDIKARRLEAGVQRLVTTPLVVRAIGHSLGHSDMTATPEEVQAFRALSLIR